MADRDNARNTALKPCEDAGSATAERGVVILDGPDGVAVTMTPEAAIGTADSLYAAATLAKQNIIDSAVEGADEG
ncbi:hypothetical protein [Variovorax sp. KK3]|uniref:hypothetical protein n=1 Tax=Variovorax sp. KK3 TaxID=1855728 RepID=UPI00097C54BF|nr:hypothetical protein [Variovorax sp. KK3]